MLFLMNNLHDLPCKHFTMKTSKVLQKGTTNFLVSIGSTNAPLYLCDNLHYARYVTIQWKVVYIFHLFHNCLLLENSL